MVETDLKQRVRITPPLQAQKRNEALQWFQYPSWKQLASMKPEEMRQHSLTGFEINDYSEFNFIFGPNRSSLPLKCQ